MTFQQLGRKKIKILLTYEYPTSETYGIHTQSTCTWMRRGKHTQRQNKNKVRKKKT